MNDRGRPAAIALALLLALVAVLLAVRLARFDSDLWSKDALYYTAVGSATPSHPALMWAPDYNFRYHPLFVLLMVPVAASAGPLLACLLATYIFHLGAVLMLARLLRRLGGGEGVARLGAALFAVFPGANNIFADPIHFGRPLTLLLALGALDALLAGRPLVYLVLWLGSLACFEDAIALPLAALAIGHIDGAPVTPTTRRVQAIAVTAMAAMVLFRAFGPATGVSLRPGLHAVESAARLPLEVAHAALVLRSDLVGPLALRLLPLLLLGALFAFSARARGSNGRVTVRLLLLAAAFSLPYLARPLEGGWPSRYLYFPACALLAAAAVPLAGAASRACAALLVYATVVGVLNTEMAARVIAERHLVRLVPAAAGAEIDRIASGLATRRR